ncbi:MAG: DUF883 domain-containing protein [Burkholderiales bacterium]
MAWIIGALPTKESTANGNHEKPRKRGGRNLQGGTEKLGKEIGGIVNEATDLLKDYGAHKLDSARATLSQAQSAVGDSAKRYARLTDGYVRDYPWTALGVAAAAGLLIGALLARR